MPVTNFTIDKKARSIVLAAEFAAPVERVWQIYAVSHQLEQIWGPPEVRSTITVFEFFPGGRVLYSMTDPEGQQHHGAWRIREVEPPTRLTFDDYFTGSDAIPTPRMPICHCEFTFASTTTGTQAVYSMFFDSKADLETVVGMGVEEGFTQAANQIDGFLSTVS